MTLSAQTRLGPYEIVSPLGAGGMGEVYRARDTRLGRDVAIKILPEEFFEDEERKLRFEREARTLASLSHPGIAAIHSFEEIPRSSPSPLRHVLVMELIEGETLRERLAIGALPVRKAADLGAQMARALAAAHERGVVHRDFKPENVILSKEGRAKILDFGLARQVAPPGSHDTNSPTVSRRTGPGVVFGTVGYMAPEQVRGQGADHRADLFALGCVLYEMLTGRRAFRGESAVETMNAILREEPPEMTTAGSTASGMLPALERIVRHCLEKSREERFQSAHDIAFDLETVLAGVAAGAAGTGRRSAGRQRVLGATLLLAFAVAGFLVGRAWHGRSGGSGRSLRPVSFQQLTDAPGVESSPTLSPDGKSVVYVKDAAGRLGLYLLRVGGRNPVPLTADSTADDWQPAFSPDGERIAFRSERDGGGIFFMGSTGESVKRVTDFGFNPTWSPDAREIAVANGSFVFPTDLGARVRGLAAVDVETGRRREVTGVGDGLQPSWSPHGYRIAYWGLRGASGQRDLWTVAADGSEARSGGLEVTNDTALDWDPVWSPDGRYLYFSSNRGGTMNLWRVRIDERSGRVLGEPEPATTPSPWSGEMSFSRDGTRLAYSSLDWRSTLLRAAFDPRSGTTTGPAVPILKSTQPIRDHQLSPDGQWIAFMQSGAQEDLFVARTDGTEYRRLTDDPFRDRGPSWSPDGKRIAFYSDRSGSYQVWTIRPDGSGLKQLTDLEEGSGNFPVWSPDGVRVAFAVIPGRWMLVSAAADAPVTGRIMPPPDRTNWFWPFSWSRDGRHIAGVIAHPDGTVGAVALYSPTSERYELMDTERTSFRSLVFLSDGRRILLRDRRGISVLDTVTKREHRIVTVGGYWAGLSVGISRDDRIVTWTETATEGDVWMAELK